VNQPEVLSAGLRHLGKLYSNSLFLNDFLSEFGTSDGTCFGIGTEVFRPGIYRPWSLPMKILVVDDHVLIREALGGVLRELRPNAVILEAQDSRAAERQVGEHPDIELILFDLNLPDRDGFAVLAELRDSHPAISIIVHSGFHDRANVVRALELGAMGFIPKNAQRAVMISALNLVFSGGIYIPPEILGPRDEAPAGRAAGPVSAPASPEDLGLTARQIEVLALMMQGKSNKAICRVLDVAEPTVKNHVTAILKALKASNRTEAVIAASALGWELPSPK
jgi:DNA-binding NarL/FixJ family response regulator